MVDCNNFYASCERVFRPELIGKPIVVLSNNDGAVIARSDEAKQLGVPMGVPTYQYEDFFKQHQVHVFSANFALYGDMSRRVMTILADFCPDIEIYSIDEAFLDLSALKLVDFKKLGEQMNQQVRQWTGIPISIGIAPTKALSKVANKIARKFPQQTQHVHIIDSEEKRIKALKWQKVEDVWGIGRQLSKKLFWKGVKTAYDFTLLEDQWVQRQFSIVELRLKKDLEGQSVLKLGMIEAKKSIATTRSFEGNIYELDFLLERVSTFAVASAEKLRKQQSYCQSLSVFVRSNSNRKDLPQYRNSIAIQLPFPTNSSIELADFACKALRLIFREGYAYKKAGVILHDFVPEQEVQLNLFQNSHPKHQALMKVVDSINTTFGQQKIRLASQDLKRVWKMRQQRLSPRYTTRIEDIIVIKV